MTIGFDARLMSVPGGIGRYCAELLTHLTELMPSVTFVVLVKTPPTNFPARTNIEWVITDIQWYGWREQIHLGRLMNARTDVSLWHIPHWNVPLTLTHPFIMTFHDFIFEAFPTHNNTLIGKVRFFLKWCAWRVMLSINMRRARAIITVSQFVQQQIAARFPTAASKTHVVYNAPGELGPPSAAQFKTPYFACIGNSYPHKNQQLILEALMHAPNFNAHVYIATHRDRFSQALAQQISARGLADRVHIMFDPTDADVAALYRDMTALIFPSKSEGFGIPPLEALSYGKPVIAAQTSSLPELIDGFATWIDPTDARGLLDAMMSAVRTPVRDADARKQHAAQFTWKRAALSTQNIYENVIY